MRNHLEVLSGTNATLPLQASHQQRQDSPEKSKQPTRLGKVEDEFTKLVQRMFTSPGCAKVPCAVTFTGVERNAGCSWVCVHAGEALAQHALGTICVVDANLRGPSLHEYFRVSNETGFTDALNESKPIENYVRRVNEAHLWLLPAGAASGQLNGILNPARLQARFAELRAHFDYVIVDTPETGAFPDGLLIGQATDGVILVLGSNSTRRESARIVKDNFDAAKVPVLGVVLNRRTYPIPEALYRRL